MADDKITTFDFEVDKENYNEGILTILSRIRPGWKKDDIKFKLMAQGIVNRMVICYVTEDFEGAVVVRIFGTLLQEIVKRDQEIKANTMLSKLGLGPELLCVFKNGLCSAFVHGRCYSVKDMPELKDIELGKAIAKELAQFHCRKTSSLAKEMGIGKGADFFALCGPTLDKWPVPFQDKKVEEWFYKLTPPIEVLREEFDNTQRIMKEVTALLPQVLCHGDLNPSNMIRNMETGRLTFVDYECVGFNIPLADIAAYMATSTFSPDVLDMEAAQHTPDYYRAFLRAYLEELRRLDGGDPVTDDDVSRWCNMVDKLLTAMQYIGLILCPSYLASNPTLTVEGMDIQTIMRPMLAKWDFYVKNKERMLALKF